MQGYRELNNAWHWAFIVYYITIYMMSDIHTSTVWIQDHGYVMCVFILAWKNISRDVQLLNLREFCSNLSNEFSDKSTHPSFGYFNNCCYASRELIRIDGLKKN